MLSFYSPRTTRGRIGLRGRNSADTPVPLADERIEFEVELALRARLLAYLNRCRDQLG
ncbi:hypothetical protein BJ998_004257 [Kutzneria kofuensis]|uniref:Uncharacterized protein n=1 Tax=Kutzneria kofuensis TaxID=103725 RepID=A0A7W9NI92_9PSEU|nr:hypothetical protein [Kutzneria kofuensis]